MTLVEDFLSCRFPSELIVHIIQCIDGWDLVAMCKANPEWEALVEAEGLWHKAAQYRWPHIAGGEQPLILGESGSDEVLTTGPGAQPIAMPAWMHALAGSSRWSLPNDHDNARANLPPPPPAGSVGEAWCRLYLSHDAFELMGLATGDEFQRSRVTFLHRLHRALRWCAEFVETAVVTTEDVALLISSFTNLESLCVASVPENLALMAEQISTCKSLKSLSIVDSIAFETSETQVCELVRGLAASGAALSELQIGYGQLNESSWRLMVVALRTMRTLHWLESLSLVGCKIGDAECVELCSALRFQRGLKHLDLCNNRLTRAAVVGGIALLLTPSDEVVPERSGGAAVVAGAKTGEPIGAIPRRVQRSITLSHDEAKQVHESAPLAPLFVADGAASTGDEAAGSVGASAKPTSALPDTEPQVPLSRMPAAGRFPEVVDTGAEARGSPASSRPQPQCKLTSLDLSLNLLAAEGTQALAELLRHAPSVEKLSLQYVTLYSREPANLLGRLLGTELGLKSLNLSLNYISACGSPVEQISAQLGSNKTLRELRVRRCCIGGWRRARALARGIMANTSLTSIDLSYNGLGAAQAAQSSSATLSLAVGTLCQAFAKNSSLRLVDLSHNSLGDAGSAAVVHAVLDGVSITSLDLHSNGMTLAGLRGITGQLGEGGHSWLPLALHAHSRHVKVARANAARGVTPLYVGDSARALASSQPYSDGEGLLYAWPLEHIDGDGESIDSTRARKHRRVPLCVDLQGNLQLSELVEPTSDEDLFAPSFSAPRRASPWDLAAAAATNRVSSVHRQGLGSDTDGQTGSEHREHESLEAEAPPLPLWRLQPQPQQQQQQQQASGAPAATATATAAADTGATDTGGAKETRSSAPSFGSAV
mmetsp:Transcript_12459/g.29337  ORF Transcript_12459/g.29337 Transcript_12459/m.29337 type:complete len:882 (+) Transcript_12459:105-2750(+)